MQLVKKSMILSLYCFSVFALAKQDGISKWSEKIKTFKKSTGFSEGLFLLKDTQSKDCMEGFAEITSTDEDFRVVLSSEPLVIGLGVETPIKESIEKCEYTFSNQVVGQKVIFVIEHQCPKEETSVMERTISFGAESMTYKEIHRKKGTPDKSIQCELVKSKKPIDK